MYRLASILALLLLSGCAPLRQTTFVHPNYNFGFVERVAVVPFENLTEDRTAGARLSRFFVTELLATETFDVVEPGEVAAAMVSIGELRVAQMTQPQIVEIGKKLRAQALFLGSVVEAATVRSGSSTENVVTLDIRLVETETGTVIWSTTHTETGRGFWASLFGTSGRSAGETARLCARHIIGRLVD